MLRVATTIFCLLALLAFTANKCSRAPFKITQAVKQNLVSGAPGGRSGTTYKINITATGKGPLHFTALWVGGLYVPVETGYYQTTATGIAKGDKVLLTANTINATDPVGNAPALNNAEAVLQYKVNGRSGYCPVKVFTQLPALSGQ